jgi:hypothetical protein
MSICRSITEFLPSLKSREYHVLFMYHLYPAMRVLEPEDFTKANDPHVGEKIFRAIRHMLVALHLVKGFAFLVSMKV